MGLINWHRNRKARKLEVKSESEESTISIEVHEVEAVEKEQSIIQPKSVIVDGKVYPSIKTASIAVGCNASTLGSHLRNGDKVYNGHEIKYKS